MNKKFLVVCFMIFMCTSALIGCDFNVGFNQNIEVKQTESAEFSKDINKISINSSSTDIKIIITKEDEIKANLYGTASSEKIVPELKIKVEKEEVNISIDYPKVVSSGSSSIDLDVYIPEKYNNDLAIRTSSGDINIEEIELSNFKGESTSGDYKINDMTAKDISIKTSSGKVTLGNIEAANFNRISTSGDSIIENIKSEEIVIKSSSGKVEINSIIADVLKGKSTSGDYYLNEVVSEEVEINASSGKVTFDKLLSQTTKSKATSGDLKIKEFKGDLIVERSSGNTQVKWIEFKNKVEIDSASGDVILDLPKNAQFKVEFKGGSGEHDIDFPIKINGEVDESEIKGAVGESDNLIKVRTSSGDLRINKR
ncbi:DUF4097 family beta strand repeat-containing protein [Oceanirhabdus sp. W0125-5]|uniref:DUF4097 family beta strand repeat-containing protein n=1 Tax=Oceanirhabdus sp. W0125-5 TaxID=2999116 RepID=UPI0022F2CF94|nr:DUF4097 family beta strand repeat-containing protein [Oceanirhabdus sp. W0125-5]WBW96288.1 DUF4097 family beta strand repeat-containing protein [Oceanirhabdus sp. W0125-5]